MPRIELCRRDVIASGSDHNLPLMADSALRRLIASRDNCLDLVHVVYGIRMSSVYSEHVQSALLLPRHT